jgi:hypothetical protein
VPVFHRTYIPPVEAPPQDEFTIAETVSPLAAFFGALLPDGWQPDKSLPNRKPRMKAEELPYYVQP